MAATAIQMAIAAMETPAEIILRKKDFKKTTGVYKTKIRVKHPDFCFCKRTALKHLKNNAAL